METAGDCYIVAGALMSVDEEGFVTLEVNPDPQQGADRVMAFSKVRRGSNLSKRLHHGTALHYLYR